MNFKSAAFALVACAAPWAQAHDIVLVPETNQLRVRYGHAQDWRSVDSEKLLELHLLRGDAAPTDVHDSLKRQGLDLVAPKAKLVGGSGAWLAAARYDNGLWAELPAAANAKPQWRNASRFTVPDPKSTTLSIKLAKAYAGTAADSATFRRTVGHTLELVPQKNPLALRAGETLPVQVLLNGKPLAGAGIEVSNLIDKIAEDKIKRYITGADGIAQVTLRTKGIHMLGVDVARPNDGTLGDAATALPVDKVVLIATYTLVR